jgi:hypothetical protein
MNLSNIRAMSTSDSAPVWRFRLVMLTALAFLVLAVGWLRARANTTAVEQRRSAMIGALRSLIAAQDAHQARTGRYALSLDSLVGWKAPDVLPLTFTPLDASAWGATVHDTALTIAPVACGVFVGREAASPHRAVIYPGSPACW